METLEQKFKNMHLLSRDERTKLSIELLKQKPKFLKSFVPKWWWWRRCKTKVLIVTDGGLNYDLGGFGLSEFLTTFNELEAQSFVNYEVTLAHRGNIINSANPVVVNHISNFTFDNTLSNFDQVWLFGISSFNSIPQAEIQEIENYMNGGGGLFATGDHGALGSAMCGNIPRVKDMRHWDDYPIAAPITPNELEANEVGMSNKRRNDTNKPQPGNAIADTFDHQSDNIPQNIAVRTFGNGLPHPLLSVSTNIRPSGIIDIMPDHPHEGECKPETSFTLNGISVPTQIVATSFVKGGNTSGGKAATDPHCFPSIAVWDGWMANFAGRIVIDSTWHHFVNINLNGMGATPGGLDSSDFEVVRKYFMNIATWMSRRKFILCWRRWIIWDLFKNSQLIEASLNHPSKDIKQIQLSELNSIGVLAEEILSSQFSPSFTMNFLIELTRDLDNNLFNQFNIWNNGLGKENDQKHYYNAWLNSDNILHTAIGSGFIGIRDVFINSDNDEKLFESIDTQFIKSMKYGVEASIKDLEKDYKSFISKFK